MPMALAVASSSSLRDRPTLSPPDSAIGLSSHTTTTTDQYVSSDPLHRENWTNQGHLGSRIIHVNLAPIGDVRTAFLSLFAQGTLLPPSLPPSIYDKTCVRINGSATPSSFRISIAGGPKAPRTVPCEGDTRALFLLS